MLLQCARYFRGSNGLGISLNWILFWKSRMSDRKCICGIRYNAWVLKKLTGNTLILISRSVACIADFIEKWLNIRWKCASNANTLKLSLPHQLTIRSVCSHNLNIKLNHLDRHRHRRSNICMWTAIACAMPINGIKCIHDFLIQSWIPKSPLSRLKNHFCVFVCAAFMHAQFAYPSSIIAVWNNSNPFTGIGWRGRAHTVSSALPCLPFFSIVVSDFSCTVKWLSLDVFINTGEENKNKKLKTVQRRIASDCKLKLHKDLSDRHLHRFSLHTNISILILIPTVREANCAFSVSAAQLMCEKERDLLEDRGGHNHNNRGTQTKMIFSFLLITFVSHFKDVVVDDWIGGSPATTAQRIRFVVRAAVQ